MMTQKQEVGDDRLPREAVLLILHIMRNLRSAATDIDFEIELSYPQILMLYVLMEREVSNMSELSSWLKISHGVATRTADRLVEKGLAERRHSDDDRRVVLVSLTNKGREHAERLISIHLEKMKAVLESFTEKQRVGLLELLRQIDLRLDE